MTNFILALVLTFAGSLSLACGEHTTKNDDDAAAIAQVTRTPASVLLASLNAAPMRACRDEIDCPPGDMCLNGQCVVAGRCQSDIDCGPGRRCQNGVCH